MFGIYFHNSYDDIQLLFFLFYVYFLLAFVNTNSYLFDLTSIELSFCFLFLISFFITWKLGFLPYIPLFSFKKHGDNYKTYYFSSSNEMSCYYFYLLDKFAYYFYFRSFFLHFGKRES